MTRPHARNRRAPSARAVAGAGAVAIAVLLLGLAGCRSRPASKTSYADQARAARARGELPWFCRSQGLGDEMDHADIGGLSNPAYAGRTKGDLSAADCEEVASMFDTALAAVAAWPTRADAKRDGWYLAVPHVPGLGTHEMHAERSRPGLDPARPYWLQYESERDDARLAGLSWVVPGDDKDVPPAGFPGDNDWLHTHWSSCEGAVGLPGGRSNEVPDDVCEAHGGTNKHTPGTWVIHAWIVPGYENRYDVFAGASACLLTGTRPSPRDACHRQPVGAGGHVHDPDSPSHTHGTLPPTTTGTGPAGSVPVTPTTPTTQASGHNHEDFNGHDHGGGHNHDDFNGHDHSSPGGGHEH